MANQSLKKIHMQNQLKLGLYWKIQIMIAIISIGYMMIKYQNESLKEAARLLMVNGLGFWILRNYKDSNLDLGKTQGIVGLQFDFLYLGWMIVLLSLTISKQFWWLYALIPIFAAFKGLQVFKSFTVVKEVPLPQRKTKLTYD